MGMFSWCCKGCGNELSRGEYVRLNGCKGEYDGYGGNSGGFNYSSCSVDSNDPLAWHDLCYRSASSDDKLDETPSKHAKNQGFGPAKLKFIEGYNENNPTTYTVVLYSGINEWQFFYTNLEKLQDQNSYEKKYEIEVEKLDFNYEKWDLLSEEEKKKVYIEERKKIEAIIGYPMPSENEKVFNSIEEAVSAVDLVLSRDLPVECNGCYDLIIFGHQGDIEGSVYERSVHERWDASGSCEDWKKLDGLEESVAYCHGK